MDVTDKTVAEIKNILSSIPETELNNILSSMKKDPRIQVQKLVKSKYLSMKKKHNENIKIQEMMRYERKLYDQGFDIPAGVDEAGRGALAGPVVAAAVILPKGAKIFGLRDSKQLSPQKRYALYDKIIEIATAWNVARVDNGEIDSKGIQWANLQALTRAVSGLSPSPDFVLSDAFSLSTIDIPSTPLIKGDAKSLSIAAASIIAKVSRDRIMLDYHESFPQYGFDNHKGYGTESHMKCITRYGTSPIHRTSFAPCTGFEQISFDIFQARNFDENTARQSR